MIARSVQNLQNIVSMREFDLETIGELIERAQAFKAGAQLQLSEPVYAANLFFENSTRTHTSFEMAERKLGMTVINFDPQHSSVAKGETLHDTLLTLDAIGVNLAVMRHSQDGYYRDLIASPDLTIGIINAGDGAGEHPSQCLLDLMTIKEAFGHFAGLRVLICGDISHSRVARSNAEVLGRLGATVLFAGPEEWYDPSFNQYGQLVHMDDVLDSVDVCMMLRVQHERHTGEQGFSAAAYREQYGLTISRATQLKTDAIIMHPGPINRGVELDGELVASRRCKFTEQMRNGVFMRMAMIERVLQARHLGGLK